MNDERLMVLAAVLVMAGTAVAKTFAVGAVNCGKFAYAQEGVSAETYAAEWSRLSKETDFDFRFFEDVGTAANLPGAVFSRDFDIRADVKAGSPSTLTVVSLPYSIVAEGVARTSNRYRVLRLTFPMNGRTLALYVAFISCRKA